MGIPRLRMFYPIHYRGEGREEEKQHQYKSWLMPKDVFDHKQYPLCLSCDRKYVRIDKGDEWCFKCIMTKRYGN